MPCKKCVRKTIVDRCKITSRTIAGEIESEFIFCKGDVGYINVNLVCRGKATGDVLAERSMVWKRDKTELLERDKETFYAYLKIYADNAFESEWARRKLSDFDLAMNTQEKEDENSRALNEDLLNIVRL